LVLFHETLWVSIFVARKPTGHLHLAVYCAETIWGFDSNVICWTVCHPRELHYPLKVVVSVTKKHL
jgi:hypothetical protein